MKAQLHRWAVGVLLSPGRTDLQFWHTSPTIGTQLLDTAPWVCGPDIRTEREYLQELYQGVLLFQERRA